MGAPEPKPQVPQLDPRIQQMADSQLKEAQDFAANAGSMKQAQGNMAQQTSNMNLDATRKNINRAANSRGLLYSGMRQGAIAGAEGSAAAKLADTQTGINQGVDQQVAALNNAALGAQSGVQNLQNQRNALAYNIAKG